MALKIKAEDLEALRQYVRPLDTPERRAVYRSRQFPRAEMCTNVNMRYRWDLLYLSGLKLGDGAGMQGDLNLYAYLNDEHIDSALRSIVPALE